MNGCVLPLDGTHHLWAPTTWAVLPDQVRPALGVKRTKGLAVGRPGHGMFVQATLSQVALPELTALRRSLSGWLAAAGGAGLDEDGIVALFTELLTSKPP